jgi:hypothetical protein
VVAGFQTSPTQGLMNLIGVPVGFFFWTLYAIRFRQNSEACFGFRRNRTSPESIHLEGKPGIFRGGVFVFGQIELAHCELAIWQHVRLTGVGKVVSHQL